MKLSLLLSLSLLPYTIAITVDPTSRDSLIAASKVAVRNLLSFYTGNLPGGTPGVFDVANWFWWMGGAAWNAMMQYWWITGDTQYNALITQALLFQVGDGRDYMPSNQSTSEANDDQAFWALAAMAAAEMRFPNPPPGQPHWLALAQAVFNQQTRRWDQNCGGGLRWGIGSFMTGYNYKNSVTNGALFHLGARLARYTENGTYVAWAERLYDWMNASGIIDPDFRVFDGLRIDNCSQIDLTEWSYNNGLVLLGSAFLYNLTSDIKWKTRVDGFLTALQPRWFQNGTVLWEAACEQTHSCDPDQFYFKGFLAQYMALTALLVPSTATTIFPLLASSAAVAGQHCIWDTSGQMCSGYWTNPPDPGEYTSALGPQMTALNLFNANLLRPEHMGNGTYVASNTTGGISLGDPNAGSGSLPIPTIGEPTEGDKALAGVFTGLTNIGMFLFAMYMVS